MFFLQSIMQSKQTPTDHTPAANKRRMQRLCTGFHEGKSRTTPKKRIKTAPERRTVFRFPKKSFQLLLTHCRLTTCSNMMVVEKCRGDTACTDGRPWSPGLWRPRVMGKSIASNRIAQTLVVKIQKEWHAIWPYLAMAVKRSEKMICKALEIYGDLLAGAPVQQKASNTGQMVEWDSHRSGAGSQTQGSEWPL